MWVSASADSAVDQPQRVWESLDMQLNCLVYSSSASETFSNIKRHVTGACNRRHGQQTQISELSVRLIDPDCGTRSSNDRGNEYRYHVHEALGPGWARSAHDGERAMQTKFLVQRGKQTVAGMVSNHLRITVGVLKGLRVSANTSAAAHGWTTPTTTFRGGFREGRLRCYRQSRPLPRYLPLFRS